jgi:hypothetical protein
MRAHAQVELGAPIPVERIVGSKDQPRFLLPVKIVSGGGFELWFAGNHSAHDFRITDSPASNSGPLTALRTFDRVRYVTWLIPIVHAVANNWSRVAHSHTQTARGTGTGTALTRTTFPQLIAVVEQMWAQRRGLYLIYCIRRGTGSGA